MASLAPFGRDDQPLLDVKIIGGKRVEVTVDKYGKPLYEEGKKAKFEGESRFSRSLSEERNPLNFNSPRNSSVPPWIREGTPPKKVLRPLPLRSPARSETSQSDSLYGSLSGSPKVLPPISLHRNDNLGRTQNGDDIEANTLMHSLSSVLQGFDTSKLKDTYMNFTGFDSTLTGFVAAEQIEQVFARYRIPVQGTLLKLLIAKFMSARRPNWVNYEQMLKLINDAAKHTATQGFAVPTLDLTTNPGDRARDRLPHNAPRDSDIPLNPNQVSPRPVNDASSTGRQSTMSVRRAFQDRQDAQLLIEMERLFKQVQDIRQQIWSLRRTLQDNDISRMEYMNSQKLKNICLRHHLPFNGSLLDKILDRLDNRNTGKVRWEEFMTFVERAVPLSSASSSATSHGSQKGGLDMPPSQPTWETRQPLQALTKRGQVIPEAAAMEQEEMYNRHKKTLDKQLTQQSQELAQVLNKQQRGLAKRQKELQKDHLEEFERLERNFEENNNNSSMQPEDEHEILEDRHKELLRKQFELIEQKRRIQTEQEELNKYIRDKKDILYGPAGDRPRYVENESRVERFLRLANALFLSARDGFLEADDARRVVKNYNLVYQLDLTTEIIEGSINCCCTTYGFVSVDDLLEELKKHL